MDGRVYTWVSQEINRVYTGVLGPVGVVPYTHGNARGIDVVGVIGGGKGITFRGVVL